MEVLERVFVDALDRNAGGELVDTPTWAQLRTPSQPFKSFNRVVLAKLEPDEVEPRVRALMAEHDSRGAGMAWTVGPSSTPADLGERLLALGMHHMGDGLGMVRAVAGERSGAWPDGLTIETADASTAEDYATITQRCWGHGEPFREACLTITRNALAAGDATFLPYLVRLDGELVASCLLRPLGEVGYFQGACVLPAVRRRGVYAAMIDHRLDALERAGAKWAVVWADPDGSAKVARRSGFRAITRAGFYEWPPPGP